MKLLSVLILSVLASGSAFGLEFPMNCRPANSSANKNIVFQVIKVVNRVGERWTSDYKIRAMGPAFPGGPVEFALRSAESGDEDYNEYSIVDARKISGLQGAYIQNRFQWVSLINTDGEADYDCRPQFK